MDDEASERCSQVRVSTEVAVENRAWVHDLSVGGARGEAASRRRRSVVTSGSAPAPASPSTRKTGIVYQQQVVSSPRLTPRAEI